ncbi:hypothetical protein Dda_7032 [Drechslerella dactyloides]|uniref:Uncharacterized protein n=1 Tax=Drechslerella dactyloides TaxID=74499 RepID=A0AAD6IXC6_DREDA|nr:hypothetical protein Dda_7032 [Drechslerella dactyloides]
MYNSRGRSASNNDIPTSKGKKPEVLPKTPPPSSQKSPSAPPPVSPNDQEDFENIDIVDYESVWRTSNWCIENIHNIPLRWNPKPGKPGDFIFGRPDAEEAYSVAFIGQVISHSLAAPNDWGKHGISIKLSENTLAAWKRVVDSCPHEGTVAPVFAGNIRANQSAYGPEPFKPVTDARPSPLAIEDLPDFNPAKLKPGTTVAIHTQLSTYTISGLAGKYKPGKSSICARLQEVFVLNTTTVLPSPRKRKRVDDD